MTVRFAPTFLRSALLAALAAVTLAAAPQRAQAEALLLVDADSGRVLFQENAGYPWYPASVSKIMTTYVTLRAVKEGRIKLDTLITVSENALAQQPSKMGFPVGTRLTVDNALKMLMVKSANDMAVVLAEGVSGTVEAFADEMNKVSARLGMTQSSWVNPNGLPADGQITSARDMAILARALIHEFPQHSLYWRLPAIKFGRRVMRNYNKLIDRYPGADGMKTGFICASGYNMVATATRNGKHLIAIVLGAPSGTQRAETAARLLERGFQGNMLAWLTGGSAVESIQPIASAPPNLREEICGKGRKNRTDHAEEEQAGAQPASVLSFLPGVNGAAGDQTVSLLGPLNESMPPVVVTVIPPQGTVAELEAAMERPRKGRRARGLAKGKGKGRQTAVIATGDKPSGGKAAKPKAAKPKAGARPAAKTGPKASPKGKGKPAPKAAAAGNPKR